MRLLNLAYGVQLEVEKIDFLMDSDIDLNEEQRFPGKTKL